MGWVGFGEENRPTSISGLAAMSFVADTSSVNQSITVNLSTQLGLHKIRDDYYKTIKMRRAGPTLEVLTIRIQSPKRVYLSF